MGGEICEVGSGSGECEVAVRLRTGSAGFLEDMKRCRMLVIRGV